MILKRQNKSVRQIAAELNVGKSTVANIIKKNNVSSDETAPEISMDVIEMPISEVDASTFLDSLGPGTSVHGDSQLPDEFLDNFMPSSKAVASKTPKGRAKKTPLAQTLEPIKALVANPPRVQAQPLDKGTLISKITMNVQNFEHVLKDVIKGDKETFLNSLHSKSLADLASTLNMFEHTRSVNNLANQLKYGVIAASAGIEMLSKKVLRLKSDGYADMIRAQDAEVTSILREMALDSNMDGLRSVQTPGVRLATLLATTLFAVDSQNRVSNTVNPDLVKQYSDL